MASRWGFGAAWVWLALAGITPSAVAQDADAPADESPGELEGRVRFQAGRTLYDQGRFTEAAEEFQRAYAATGRPELLYNVFLSQRDAGNLAGAIESLSTYLRLVPNVENRAALEARLESMRRLHEQGGGDPGDVEDAGGDDAPPPASGGGGSGTWVPGWIIAGVGAAVALVSIATGVLALDQRAQLDTLCGADRRCPDGYEGLASDGALYAGLTDGLLIGGLVVAATGVVLALVVKDGGGDEVAFGCGPLGCTVRGTF